MDPGPSSTPLTSIGEQSSLDSTVDEQMTREGGVQLMAALLSKACPPNEPTPTQYRDIVKLPSHIQEEWKTACLDELEALRQRNVFKLCDLPPNRKAIRNRWVFATKSDGRKKARLVAKGFSQVEGIDFDEIFSPVVRYETVRLMLALATLENWTMSALDVKSAFLYGKLNEEIYMEQPQGFIAKGQEHKVFRLLRSIYGLKQAALSWWNELNLSMEKLHFHRIQSDACIFVYKQNNELCIAIVYVDDAIFLGPNCTFVEKLKCEFMDVWDSRDLGEPSEFLGILFS
jgi:hypothetical protein